MPAISIIAIGDGQTTPVIHTFDPAKSTSDYSMYENRVGGIYIGYEKLHLSMTRPKGDSKAATRNLKVALAIECPVLETLGNSDTGLTPPPTVAFRPMVKVEFTLPERCTTQNRKDLRKLLQNALSDGSVASAIDNLSMPW